MDFKNATDALLDRVTHADLAEALGVSVALVRQARLDRDAQAHRAPPKGWDDAVLRLAESRLVHYRSLIKSLRQQKEAQNVG